MAFIRALSLVAFLAALAGCGFSPLYGTHGDTAIKYHFDSIAIGNIPDREGLYLRNALIDRLYDHGRPAAPQYTLNVAGLRQRITDLDITKSADATRAQLRIETKMTLLDSKTGETLLQRDLVAVASYNILQSRFTTRVSEDDARRAALDDIARQIEQQLALYFGRSLK